jgi:4-amino-4-deoxy-L-arabinose transferase-like glycosyltransferase
MFDTKTGNRAGTFLALCPGFAGNGFLMTPDTLFAVFWAVALYAAWKAMKSPETGIPWWAFAGSCAGLGLLSKYNMILFFLGLGFLWLVSPGRRRKILYGIVISGSVALVLFIPVLLWNFENDWVSFRFQLRHGFSEGGFKPWATFPGYIGGLMLVATPLLGGLAFWRAFGAMVSGDEARRFLGVFFWAVVLFFAASALKGEVSANWPMVAFFSGVILVAADWRLLVHWLRKATVGLLAVVMLLGLSYLSLPADFAIAVGGRSLDAVRMKEFIGGRELAEAAQRKRNELNLDFVCVSRYQLLGELAFYAPDLRPRLWVRKRGSDRFPWIDHQKWRGRSALLISRRPKSWPMFQEVHPLGRLDIPYKKNLKRTLYFYRGVGYQPEMAL